MALEQAIALLLVFDLSGSMQQKVEQETKITQLKNQARALLSTKSDSEKVETIMFGSEPVKKCADLKIHTGTATEAWHNLQSKQPGAMGKTPLARALKQVTQDVVKHKIKTVVLMTDGADTCNEDPCGELQKLQAQMKKNKTHLDLILIGYDLKNEERKLECFREAQKNSKGVTDLEGLNVQFFSSKDSWGLQEAMAKSMTEASDAQKALEKVRAETKARALKPGQEKAGEEFEAKKIEGAATITVNGAAATDLFKVSGPDGIHEWFGGLPLDVSAGAYQITYINPNGKSLKIDLHKKEQKEFVLADFLIRTTENVNFSETRLGYELVPAKKTMAMHRDLKNILVPAVFNGGKNLELPLGVWTAKVIAPAWIRAEKLEEEFSVDLNTSTIETAKIQKNIRWFKNDQSNHERVLQLIDSEKKVQTFLVPVGVLNSPVPLNMKPGWLDK